jgi:hypothetical protein
MRLSLPSLLAWMLLPVGAAAQSAGFSDEPSQRALASGEVAVHTSIVSGEPGGRVRAAVMIHAQRETVWQLLRDCESAPAYVPGLRRCHRIDAAPDGSWETLEHVMKYNWLMPPARSVLRLEYHSWQIDFHRLSGDMKAEEGSWRVQRTDDDTATLVEYEVWVDPGFWVPAPIVRASLRHELPAALLALRNRAESIELRSASAH